MLAPLAVDGNRIVSKSTGAPVLLRGVNRSGLEYCRLDETGISEAEWDEIAAWGANVVRIPFNQAWALERPGYDARAYLAALDSVIEMGSRRGMYTILDLQWLDDEKHCGYTADGEPNFVPALPDRVTPLLWRQLAHRYRDEPAALFDLLNEPHDPLADDTHELLGVKRDGRIYRRWRRRVRMRDWQSWARLLVGEIRAVHPGALILVAGVDWAYDLRGHPIPGIEGIVYSTHVYPGKRLSWDTAFGHLVAKVPVFAGEWGGGSADLAWGRELAEYLMRHNLSWTAWSWSDRPHLIEPGAKHSFKATPFGGLVRGALRSTLFDVNGNVHRKPS